MPSNNTLVTSGEILSRKGAALPLPVQWRRFLGNITASTRLMVFGAPGTRKSTLVIRLADMFSKLGKVLYVMSEEKIDAGTLQERMRVTKSSLFGVDVLETTSLDEIKAQLAKKKYDYVIIDSINEVNAKVEQTMTLDSNYDAVFVFVVQMLKSRKNYKGSGELEHYVDVVIQTTRSDGGRYIASGEGKNRLRHLDPLFEMEL